VTGGEFVLASASPRRVDLLAQIGVTPDAIVPADIDEAPQDRELPASYAERVAMEKARVVSEQHPDAFVLAADTVVSVGRRILPKAEDPATARACLNLLSGRRHRVYGGVCLIRPDGKLSTRLVQTAVAFKRLEVREIDMLIESGEWSGKAGGYAIQGLSEGFIRFINGSYSNVVGLPLFDVRQMLVGGGYLA